MGHNSTYPEVIADPESTIRRMNIGRVREEYLIVQLKRMAENRRLRGKYVHRHKKKICRKHGFTIEVPSNAQAWVFTHKYHNSDSTLRQQLLGSHVIQVRIK